MPPIRAGNICSWCGWRKIGKRPQWHFGVDFCAKTGTPIYAVDAGRVEHRIKATGGGKSIRLHHADGVTSYYAHLSGFETPNGARVSKGRLIGRVGATGARGKSPHLHFEFHRDWKTWLHYDDLNEWAESFSRASAWVPPRPGRQKTVHANKARELLSQALRTRSIEKRRDFLKKAAAALKEADPNDAAAAQLLKRVEQTQARFREAEELLKTAVSKNPADSPSGRTIAPKQPARGNKHQPLRRKIQKKLRDRSR